MRELRTCAWVAVVVAAAAAPAAAQQATISSTGGRTTGSLTGTGGLAGGGSTGGGIGLGGGNSLGGGGGGGGSGGTSSSSPVSGGIQLQQQQAAPMITAPTGTASGSLNASNFLSGYYANPYYQGISATGSSRNAQPGGFGMPLYGNSSTGRGALNSGGLASSGAGGRNALGGQSSSTQSGILIPIQSQIAYTATMQFPTPPVASGKILSDIRAVIDATPAITNSKTVLVITDANNNVTLRGSVKDDDEARLIEGLVRLTPGVGTIRNELAPAVAAR